MKKTSFIVILVMAIAMIASCNRQGAQSQGGSPSDAFINSLSNEDSVQMMKLCDDCMNLLKQREIESAVNMLCEYDDSTKSVLPLSDEARVRYMRLFTLFPVLDYNCTEITFMDEGLNNVKYEFVFALEENPAENGVPKTALMFNPVKVDGVWYLTVKRPDQKISLQD